MTYIPLATIRRMLKELFPEDKISHEAISRLGVLAEDFIKVTYIDAKKFTEASGRKIVMETDVMLAT